MKILKWEIVATCSQTIEMPKQARILSIQLQKEKIVLWALCDETLETELRVFDIYLTGENLPHDIGEYLATIYNPINGLAFHIFEILN
jgi:hypothetical protein